MWDLIPLLFSATKAPSARSTDVCALGLDVPSQCKPLKYWLSAYLAGATGATGA